MNTYNIIDNFLHFLVEVSFELRGRWDADVDHIKYKDHSIGAFCDFCLKGNVNLFFWPNFSIHNCLIV